MLVRDAVFECSASDGMDIRKIIYEDEEYGRIRIHFIFNEYVISFPYDRVPYDGMGVSGITLLHDMEMWPELTEDQAVQMQLPMEMIFDELEYNGYMEITLRVD